VEGTQPFPSGSLSYDVDIHLPAEPRGAPILFVFHGLGGNGIDIQPYLGVPDMVASGAIAVSPRAASGAEFDWEFVRDEGNPDQQMFLDLLGCAQRQFDVDMGRVWATGMSAGGLFISYLIMHDSNWLTAAAPFSGGTIGVVPPSERPIPVLQTWGGPDDVSHGLDFDGTNRDLGYWLQEYGHPLIECVHDLGHAIPPEAPAMVKRFFRDQRWGDGDPFAAGLPPELPSWCRQL
jgi:poly(3-hydroxybutyrate) depolymerase